MHPLSSENMSTCRQIRKAVSRGYKIGLTSARMQAMCGIDSPLAGVVLSDRVHFSGVRIARSDYGRLGLELEIAVKMAGDLSGGRHTVDEVSAAVEHVCPAIEIVDDRNADYSNLEALSLISDNSWRTPGRARPLVDGDWPDLAEIEGRATIDGAEIGRGRGRDGSGGPSLPRRRLARRSSRKLRKRSACGRHRHDWQHHHHEIPQMRPAAIVLSSGGLGAVEVSIE